MIESLGFKLVPDVLKGRLFSIFKFKQKLYLNNFNHWRWALVALLISIFKVCKLQTLTILYLWRRYSTFYWTIRGKTVWKDFLSYIASCIRSFFSIADAWRWELVNKTAACLWIYQQVRWMRRRTPEKTLGKGRAQREIIPKNTLQPKVFRSRWRCRTNISGCEISMRQDYLLIDDSMRRVVRSSSGAARVAQRSPAADPPSS